jgi:hypothetical protein
MPRAAASLRAMRSKTAPASAPISPMRVSSRSAAVVDDQHDVARSVHKIP